MIEYDGKAPVSMLSDFLLKTGFLLSGPDKQAQVRASTLLLIYSKVMEKERLVAMEPALALSEYARKDKPASEKARRLLTIQHVLIGNTIAARFSDACFHFMALVVMASEGGRIGKKSALRSNQYALIHNSKLILGNRDDFGHLTTDKRFHRT
ncbi:hypothetical protein CI102_1639 [Trichoderma harzianum]|nr:hypothetical protein CI102_1639 [Trichoderma harzianum]